MMDMTDSNSGGDGVDGTGSNNNNDNTGTTPGGTTQSQQQNRGSGGTTTSTVPRSLITTPNPLPRAADLLFANSNNEEKLYWDRSHYESPDAQMKALAKSSTLYVGNLAFSTRATYIKSHFTTVGPVKSIQVGLDRFKKTPCGFCFVEYYSRRDALLAVANLSGSKLDGRIIRVELDAGFQPGRQYGRGASGGQVRDDRRTTNDPARRNRNNNRGGGGGGGGGGGLNWTPPDHVRNNEENKSNSNTDNYFGPAGDANNSKRERDDAANGGDADMDRPDKNPRFRED